MGNMDYHREKGRVQVTKKKRVERSKIPQYSRIPKQPAPQHMQEDIERQNLKGQIHNFTMWLGWSSFVLLLLGY